MLEADGKDFNERWGYLSRAGLNDKSQFTRQIEKYAGALTSTSYSPLVLPRSEHSVFRRHCMMVSERTSSPL